jgi:anti-sigma factor RsiW
VTDPFLTDDAAYVLGALPPQDRAAFEEHLQGCAQCSAAVAELAGVPGLLGRVSAEDARGFVDPDRAPVPVPETLLPRLQRSVRQRRRRRTIW